jgi:cell division septation protein DedD
MLKRKLILLLLFPLMNLMSCSSSIEQTREEETPGDEGVYVFDRVPEDTSTVHPAENYTSQQKYYSIQIGAFTTKERAEKFAEESKSALSKEVLVMYNAEVNLFVVQLKNHFKSKDEAEKVRNDLRANEKYKDAWVVTVTK